MTGSVRRAGTVLAVGLPILLAVGLDPWPARAQTINNVNDCTLLTDPVSLRRCVDGFAGRIQRPADPAPPQSPEAEAPQSDGRPTPAPAAAAGAAPPRRVTRPPPGGWLPETSRTGRPIRSNPDSILFDR